GAGVIGLTTAIVLRKNGFDKVTIVAKYHPGDPLTHEFTSPWAGASIVSFAQDSDSLQAIDLVSFQEFMREADHVPEAGVMYCPGVHYSEVDDPAAEAWAKKAYLNTAPIPKEELPDGVRFGYRFLSSWCLPYIVTTHAPRYLEWLVKSSRALGISLERGEFSSISQVARRYPQADVIVNCTGLGARRLADVRDSTVHAVRGQTVLVRAPHQKTQLYREGPNTYTYIIPRPDGNVIVGGTLDYDNTSIEPSRAITQSILKRCYALCPDITHHRGPGAFEIISENVGFRPSREAGVRLEKQIMGNRGAPARKITVVHNYGHGAHGYQSCWGSATRVLELLQNGPSNVRARL
ncbi:hypothetical protein BX666DRAFT_1851580, partial [Dichotomocladium elegans]